MMGIPSNAWSAVGEVRMICLRQVRGFTLLEMLVAMVVAAILTTVSQNVYAVFQHGILDASDGYVRFAMENARELRCRTRFARGFPPCDSVLSDERYTKIRLRF